MKYERFAINSTKVIWCITIAIFVVTTGSMMHYVKDTAFCTIFGDPCSLLTYQIEKIIIGALFSANCFALMQHIRLKVIAMQRGKECFIVEQKYRTFLTEANDAIIVIDVRTGRITEANKAAERLLGRPMERLIGMHRTEIHPQASGVDYELFFASIIREGNMHAEEIEVLHASGRMIPVDMSASLIRMNGDTVVMGILRDISLRLCAQREAERYITELRALNERLATQKQLLDEQTVELEKQVRTDVLTGLPNRNSFLERIDLAQAASLRYGHTVALMFVDLDKFKSVNDHLGHDMGDAFLQVVADRGKEVCKRNTELFARLGGDEFVVLLPEVRDEEEAVLFAKTLLAKFNEPFTLAGNILHIEASIGIAVGVGDTELLKRADEAMYTAKQTGNCYIVA